MSFPCSPTRPIKIQMTRFCFYWSHNTSLKRLIVTQSRSERWRWHKISISNAQLSANKTRLYDETRWKGMTCSSVLLHRQLRFCNARWELVARWSQHCWRDRDQYSQVTRIVFPSIPGEIYYQTIRFLTTHFPLTLMESLTVEDHQFRNDSRRNSEVTHPTIIVGFLLRRH